MTTELEARHAKATELQQSISHCNGGDEQYAHWTRSLKFTQGVQYLAEKAGAFWLIDVVAS